MLELLAGTYHDLGYIMDMDYSDGWLLMLKAQERRNEDRMYALYAALYPNFTDKTFITFKEFYKQQRPKKAATQPKTREQIFDEVNAMRDKYFGGR